MSLLGTWMAARFDDHDGRIRGTTLQNRRLRIWRKNPHCVMCGRLTNYSGPDCFNLDHKIPLYKGGPDTDANSQVLCQPCHQVKTNDDLGRRNSIAIGLDGWPT